MYEKVLAKIKNSDLKKLGVALGFGVIIAICAVTLLLTQLTKPERSVAAYCKVYAQEKARLAPMSNSSNPYPSGVFDVTVSDANQLAKSFDRLVPVAPSEIESQVASLQKLYQDMHDNPSHLVTDSINGGPLDDSLKTWTRNSCKAL